MATGVVKWLWFSSRKGFGFITPDEGGADAFVHFRTISGGGYEDLVEGQRVEFDVRAAKSGPRAANARALV